MSPFAFLTALAIAQSLPTSSIASDARAKWALDYAPNVCILSRARIGDAGGIMIETRPYETQHEFSMLLPKVGRGSFVAVGILSVLGAPSAFPRVFAVDETRGNPDRIVTGSIGQDQLNALTKDLVLGIVIEGKLSERVSVAGLAKALIALVRCEEDLARRWGIPRQWATDPQPLSDTAGIVRHEDYPQTLVEADIQGSARLILQIGADGQIERCRAIETVGPGLFAEVVCSAYRKRLRFTPAKDSTGVAVPSFYVIPEVRFVLAG